jgi:hypothetical protein
MGRLGQILGVILWLAIGVSFGVIAALWLVIWAGTAYGAAKAFSLYSQHPLNWTTVALVAEEEWFWVSAFLTHIVWPIAVLGAMTGPGLMAFLDDYASWLRRRSDAMLTEQNSS